MRIGRPYPAGASERGLWRLLRRGDLGVEPFEVLLKQSALAAEFVEPIGHGAKVGESFWRGKPGQTKGAPEGAP